MFLRFRLPILFAENHGTQVEYIILRTLYFELKGCFFFDAAVQDECMYIIYIAFSDSFSMIFVNGCEEVV